MSRNRSIAVTLPGHGTFWFLRDEDGTGPLAPKEHCTETGEIANLATALFLNGDSYAHVFADGNIRRYREVIGTVADLVELP